MVCAAPAEPRLLTLMTSDDLLLSPSCARYQENSTLYNHDFLSKEMRAQLCTRGNPGGVRSLVTAIGPIYMPDGEPDADGEPARKRARGRSGTGGRAGARKPTGSRSKPTRKRKADAEEDEDEDAMDKEEDEDEDAMDEEEDEDAMDEEPMTAREMEASVEATLNVLFGRVRDDVPFDELYKTLISKVPRALLTGREAVEEALNKMEEANKVIYREGRIHLI